MMMIEVNVDALLGLIESAFDQFRSAEADPTDLFFPDRNTLLNFKEEMNEQIEKLSEFLNIFGGDFLVDKSESVAQLTLFIGDEEGLSSLTKTFSINY